MMKDVWLRHARHKRHSIESRHKLSGAFVAVALIAVAVACTPLQLPGDTSSISFVSTTTVSGWKLDYYVNEAYPCSISGFQTFTIGTKVGSASSAHAPLWTFMHGGGAGFFDTSGTPRPDATQMTQEPAVNQRSNLMTTTGLLARVRADAAGYRLLAVSYCNRDGYLGTSQTDPSNPNTNADGTAKRDYGLYSVKAAVQYAESAHPTSRMIVHGASAGSLGAYYVGYGLQRQGVPPAGVIGDASVLNAEADSAAYQQGACTKGNYSPAGQAALAARVDPSISEPVNEVDRLVAAGTYTVPLLHIWNHHDVSSCGAKNMVCPLRNGSSQTLSVTDCEHGALADAIDGLGTGTKSKNLPLCVTTAGGPGPCDKHQVTIDAAGLTNTDPTSAADYMTTIMNWADARVSDAAGS